LIAKEIE